MATIPPRPPTPTDEQMLPMGVFDEVTFWHWLIAGVVLLILEMFAPGVVFTPFHFGGWYDGKDLLDKYPEGTAPYVRGEACNTAFTYGYDSVTQMQETKVTLCRVKVA